MDNPSRKHLLVGAEDWPPWFLINSITSQNLTSVSYGGIMWDVLLQLSRSMNFTFSIIRPPDGKWGILEANGSWNGMVGMVSRQEVDFALGPFGMSTERSEVIDFTFPLRQDILVTVSPVGMVPDVWVIWRPFGIKVWITFIITFFTFLLLFGMADKIFLKRSKWKQTLEFLLRTLTGDGSIPLSRTWNYQAIFTMTWILAMFILGQGYSGTLASLMTIPKVPKMIDDVSDLVDQRDIPWGLETGTILEQTGSEAQPGSLLYKFYNGAQKIKGSCYADLDKIKSGELIRLCEGLTALSMLSDDFSKEGKCLMYAGKGSFMSFSYAIILQKASNLTTSFNDVIHNMIEGGIVESSISNSLPNATKCSTIKTIVQSFGQSFQPLSLRSLSGLGAIYVIGMASSICAFLVEIIAQSSFFSPPVHFLP